MYIYGTDKLYIYFILTKTLHVLGTVTEDHGRIKYKKKKANFIYTLQLLHIINSQYILFTITTTAF